MMRKMLILGILAIVFMAGPVYAQSRCEIVNLTLTSAGTEYSVTFPTYMYTLDIRSRTAADFKIATVAGQSGTTYFTVKSGEVFYKETLLVGSPTPLAPLTLYFQSANAGQVIEITYCRSR